MVLILADSWLQRNPWASDAAIAVVGILATALVAGIVYAKSKKRKHIDYQILSDASLLSERAQSVDQLKVTIRDRVLVNPRVVTIQFVNTGNTEIVAGDFQDPIVVKHGGDARALDVSVIASSGQRMLERTTQHGAGQTYVEIIPRLMNSGEGFTIQLLYEGAEEITVSSWITGQTRPMQEIPAQRFTTTFLGALADVVGRVAVSLIGFSTKS